MAKVFHSSSSGWITNRIIEEKFPGGLRISVILGTYGLCYCRLQDEMTAGELKDFE
jgi:predicted DNA-binding ArsR family transcriptional regulator